MQLKDDMSLVILIACAVMLIVPLALGYVLLQKRSDRFKGLTEKYLDDMKLLIDADKSVIRQLVDWIAPRRRHWWQAWRRNDEYRYKLAFMLVSFRTSCRR